jgi:hypothetical protein
LSSSAILKNHGTAGNDMFNKGRYCRRGVVPCWLNTSYCPTEKLPNYFAGTKVWGL